MPRDDGVYSCTFVSLLYPDCEDMQYAIDTLKGCAYETAYALHENCVNEDGTPKKAHYHFVIRFTSQKSLSKLARELKLEERWLKPSSSIKKALLYLIHRGWPDKYQYSVDAVGGSLKKQLLSYLDDRTEDERMLLILDLLDNFDGRLRMADFIKLCCAEGLYADMRRSGYMLVACLREHNDMYYGTDYCSLP